MTSRAFGITFAAIAGTPLLAAGILSVCESTTAAVIACLALALGGALGAIVGGSLVATGTDSLRGTRQPRPELDASLDAETRKALLLLGDKIAGKDRA